MLILTLAILAILAASPPEAPTRAELAKAITKMTSKRVTATSIRGISCKPIGEELSEFACRWQQRSTARWRSYSSFLTVDSSGWILIDLPGPVTK